MSQCKIYLENYSGVYYAGSEIRGRLECYFDDNITVRGIKVRFKCKEHNSWTGTETYRDPADDKTKTRHITLTGDNNVMFVEQMVFGSDSGTREMGRGRHVYPFSFMLPHDIPSTFNGPHGSICYKVKAIVDRPMRTDYEDVFIFIVQSPIDFNHMSQDLQNITTYSDEKTVCCWCCKGGEITMDVELPKTAFVPGETIPFKVSITNLSNSNVDNLKVKFVKTITYRVRSPHSESKEDVDEIINFTEHGVGAHGEYTYNLTLQIPGYVEVPNFAKCELFNVSYELKVCAEMPSCTLDLDISAWDIKMGHVQCAPSGGGETVVPPGFVNPAPIQDGFSPAPYFPPKEGFQPPPGGIYPPPSGPYPPPSAGAYPGPPSPYPGPPQGGYPPYPPEKGVPPTGPPSAPSSSIASAPPDDNPKAREATNSYPGQANTSTELPPPSYNDIQKGYTAPYPPQ